MTDLITLAQARASLRVPASQTVDDADLTDLITSATAIMEDLCGPIISRPGDDWLDGGGCTVRLLQAPILSVTTVTESYGAGYTRTLTAQPLDGTGFDSFGYTVDLVDGILTRRVSGIATPFVNGRRNIHVTYTAGRSSVPNNIQRATRRLVRWLWQTEMQGQRPSGSAPEAVSTSPSGFDVPNAVKTICAGELRIPGIA